MGLIVEQFINSVFSSNSYVVHDEDSALIIDLGDFIPIHDFFTRKNLNVKGVFITHAHYDHIYGLREFMKAYANVPIYTSSFGKEALANSKWNFSRYHNDEIIISSDNIMILQNEELNIKIDGTAIRSIMTPGHDKSCLSYIIDNKLFTGDSYIPGVKVVDTFPNSNKAEAKYWYEQLDTMSQQYDIYPGHGDTKYCNTM